MKFPFDFGIKLIFRLILPGAILAAAMAPAVHAAMHALGILIRIEFALPFEVVAWGWAIVVCDMRIYMLFEGRRYWPEKLRTWMVNRQIKRLNALVQIVEGDHPEDNEYLEAAVEYGFYPVTDGGDPCVRHPTRLGNIIESFETYPEVKYGLDAIFYWYRLWVVIDKDLREEIDNAQSVADSAIYIVFALYCSGTVMLAYALMAFIPVHLPYVPSPLVLLLLSALCFVGGFVLYRLSLPVHCQFGELFKSVFDEHRSKLVFDDLVKHIGTIRGAPYVSLNPWDTNRIVWRYLRWHRIRDERVQKNFKVKDWPRP